MYGGLKKMSIIIAMAAVIMAAASIDVKWAAAQEHHVVGGDRGWAVSTDLDSWSAGKIFRVGDNIWFAYSAAQESVLELKNKEEYESCNLENPIKMYTDGIDRVPLHVEGTRYFTSSKPESCNGGLKLNVTVLPRSDIPPVLPDIASSEADAVFAATAPASPSASTRLYALSSMLLMFVGLGLCSWMF